MYTLGKITITTVLPEELKRLKDIAYNLWWSWNPEALDLFKEIDLPLWERLGKNPVRFLQEVSQKKLDRKVEDPVYMQRYQKIVNDFDSYMSDTETWFNRNYPDKKKSCDSVFFSRIRFERGPPHIFRGTWHPVGGPLQIRQRPWHPFCCGRSVL